MNTLDRFVDIHLKATTPQSQHRQVEDNLQRWIDIHLKATTPQSRLLEHRQVEDNLQRWKCDLDFDAVTTSSFQQWCVDNHVGRFFTALRDIGCDNVELFLEVTEQDMVEGKIPSLGRRALTKLQSKEHGLRAELAIEHAKKLTQRGSLNAQEFERIRQTQAKVIMNSFGVAAEDKKFLFTILPKHEDLAAVVFKDEVKVLGPLPCAAPLDLSQLEDGDYMVGVFVPRHVGDLEPWKGLKVSKQKLNKTGGGVDPAWVDTGASDVTIKSIVRDQPSKGGDVHIDNTITRKLNEAGTLSIALPPKKYEVQTPAGKQNLHVAPRTPATSPDDELAKKVMPMMNECRSFADQSFFASGTNIALCGDVSGSMHGNGIVVLQRSFKDVIAQRQGTCTQIRLYSWNDGWSPCSRDPRQWNSWIDALMAGGGNDMQQALTKTIADFPEVTDIFTMCDGDVTPFTDKTWDAYRKRYPKVTFHFIGIGTHADHATMSQMAGNGGGNFTAFN